MAKAKQRAGRKKAAGKVKKIARRKPVARKKAVKRKPVAAAPAATSPMLRPVVIPGAWPFPMGSKP